MAVPYILWSDCILGSGSFSLPEGEKRRNSWVEVAAARKLRPAATHRTCSVGGRPRVHSLLAAQDSNGRQTNVLGASLLDGLPYRAPCIHDAYIALHIPLFDKYSMQYTASSLNHSRLSMIESTDNI